MEDSITRLPKYHRMQKEINLCFFAIVSEKLRMIIINANDEIVVTGLNIEYERGKS